MFLVRGKQDIDQGKETDKRLGPEVRLWIGEVEVSASGVCTQTEITTALL